MGDIALETKLLCVCSLLYVVPFIKMGSIIGCIVVQLSSAHPLSVTSSVSACLALCYFTTNESFPFVCFLDNAQVVIKCTVRPLNILPPRITCEI